MVRTSPFHGGNRGSNPLGVTKAPAKHRSFYFLNATALCSKGTVARAARFVIADISCECGGAKYLQMKRHCAAKEISALHTREYFDVLRMDSRL